MRSRLVPFLLLAFALIGCAVPSADQSDRRIVSPRQAVMLAADAAPAGVRGTFEMTVQRVGRQEGNIYLDSELDYRDQRNLVIAIHPNAARLLHEKLGRDVDEALFGKRIRIYGEAKRVKISFVADGKLSDSYYYQTHVDIWDSGQITVIP
jgi:hypothetical protein